MPKGIEILRDVAGPIDVFTPSAYRHIVNLVGFARREHPAIVEYDVGARGPIGVCSNIESDLELAAIDGRRHVIFIDLWPSQPVFDVAGVYRGLQGDGCRGAVGFGRAVGIVKREGHIEIIAARQQGRSAWRSRSTSAGTVFRVEHRGPRRVHGLRAAHDQFAAQEFLVMQLRDRPFRFLDRLHLDEGKSFRFLRVEHLYHALVFDRSGLSQPDHQCLHHLLRFQRRCSYG